MSVPMRLMASIVPTYRQTPPPGGPAAITRAQPAHGVGLAVAGTWASGGEVDFGGAA